MVFKFTFEQKKLNKRSKLILLEQKTNCKILCVAYRATSAYNWSNSAEFNNNKLLFIIREKQSDDTNSNKIERNM